MAEQSARERIIEAGARLIHRNGFNNTGIKEVLDAAGVPKGSFYFHFKNKEDFGVQLVDFFVAFLGDRAKAALADTSVPPMDRLRGMLRSFRAYFEEQGCALGCPVGNLAQEMGDLSPAFRDRLGKAIEGMSQLFAGPLSEAQRRGELPAGMEPLPTARFVVSAWHGALVRMKVDKNTQALDLFEEMVFDRLLVCKQGNGHGTGKTD